jgi:organic hydroperoxide reductase OsmC/OhrA
MTPLPHFYNVHVAASPTGHAEVSAAGLPTLHTAPPADYDGPGDAWSPEHLLLAAVQSCFVFTFRAIARLSKLEFERLALDATGTVDRDAGITRFVEIVLRAGLTVRAGADRARALQVLEKTAKNCVVSASLSVPVRVEAEVGENDSGGLTARDAHKLGSVEP